jgi:hypothetical protein
MYDMFIKKLINENRITKYEISSYIGKKDVVKNGLLI